MSARAAEAIDAANALVTGRLTIDMHSHGGGFIREDTTADPVVDAMRAGGLAVACLAIVSDSPTHKIFADRTIHPVREPDPGELYAWSKASFARLLRLAQGQGARLVGSAADLRAAPASGPAVVVAAEGADFLEGRIDRVEEARRQFGLRHLQLVHYRPNELGDIQTENPVHNGLTDFGVEVVRTCNRLGIVVDVAHATYEVVKRAAAATSRPADPVAYLADQCAGAAQPPDLRRPCPRRRADRRCHRRVAARLDLSHDRRDGCWDGAPCRDRRS